MKNHRNHGFTLIELVVVITIIGILAAFALPKYAELQAEARIAKMRGALASLKSASALAHAQLLTKGFSATYTNAAAPFALEGVDAIFTNGYPNADTIRALAGIESPDFDLPAVAAGVATVRPDANHTSCDVAYTEATATAPPQFGSANLTTANCQ